MKNYDTVLHCLLRTPELIVTLTTYRRIRSTHKNLINSVFRAGDRIAVNERLWEN